MGELELVAKLLSGGGILAFSALVWYEVRSERKERREDRRDHTEALKALGDVLARIDERTAHIVGDLAPVDTPRPLARVRGRTPPKGVPSSEYIYSRRKPDDEG